MPESETKRQVYNNIFTAETARSSKNTCIIRYLVAKLHSEHTSTYLRNSTTSYLRTRSFDPINIRGCTGKQG